ncbi:hypothetical protein NPIL_279551 [Nephila pilipes]|uniref:Uncharacterized protein n=1 Tax=Nephila pilipes TaxID=299642 RepID=A0A8X6T8E1_NEPPI|nr:hypothetical protein NPIL_279551 [Nephila pilipes]
MNIIGTTSAQTTFYKVHKTVFLPGGKLERPSLGPPDGGTKVINRLYLWDKASKLKYLIDTGVEVSAIPLSAASKDRPPSPLQHFVAR